MSATPLEKILSIALLVPHGNPKDADCHWGLNVMLWGDPGIGKSDRAQQAANACDLPMQVVYAATSQPEDVSGAAFPDGKGGARILPLLPGILKLVEDKKGVLFLDELSCARPAVQAAFLGVTLARRVGDIHLPPGVRIVAAANPPSSAAGGWDLEPPMANRFCHFNVDVPSADEWGAWLLAEGTEDLQPIHKGEAVIRKNWPKEWARTKGIVAGFLNRRPTLLYSIPEEGSPDRGRAWPSHRTWTFAARAMATCFCLGESNNVAIDFVEGCVGAGPASELAAWLAAANLPTPQEMLAKGYQLDMQRLDLVIAAYTGMTAHVVALTGTEKVKMGAVAWKRLQDLIKNGMMDVAMNMATSLVTNGLGTKADPKVLEAAQPVLTELARNGMGRFVEGK